MLVLTRRAGEAVMLGDDIEVTVVELVGETKVRIGVDAPSSLRISRKDFVHEADDGAADEPEG